jgi:hypothetical protein
MKISNRNSKIALAFSVLVLITAGFTQRTASTAATHGPFNRSGLKVVGQMAVGVLMITVFCWVILSLINAPGPGIEIISSDIPSVADVEDWLISRGRRSI